MLKRQAIESDESENEDVVKSLAAYGQEKTKLKTLRLDYVKAKRANPKSAALAE